MNTPTGTYNFAVEIAASTKIVIVGDHQTPQYYTEGGWTVGSAVVFSCQSKPRFLRGSARAFTVAERHTTRWRGKRMLVRKVQPGPCILTFNADRLGERLQDV
jgi:hypothetical protein